MTHQNPTAAAPSIKFSHRYAKMRAAPDDRAVLLDVVNIRLEERSKAFLDYDTQDGLYTLPKSGLYMMLIFEGKNGLFTTLRSAWPDHKQAYYRGLIGKTFTLVFDTPSALNP